MITKEILELFKETFEEVTGYYLDKKTSVFETISHLSAATASEKRTGIDETIAGHINHLTFYMVVLQEYITDKRSGKTDWNESWKIEAVNDEQWALLVDNLIAEYRKLCEFIEGIEEWSNGDYLGGVISILAHCAYHLGAIRQLR